MGDELVSKKLRDWREVLAAPDEPEGEDDEAPVPSAAAAPTLAERPAAAPAPAVDARVAVAVGLALVLATGALAWRWSARQRAPEVAAPAAIPAAEVARPLPQPEAPPPAPPPAPPGVLVLDAQPWGRIESVRAVATGEAVPLPRDGWTPQRLSLAAGLYAVRVTHPEFGARELEVEVVGGGVERRSVRFGGAHAESFLGRR